MPKLCFGSYATIIKLHSEKVSNPEFVNKLVGTIDPQNKYLDKYSDSQRLLNCRVDFRKGKYDGSHRSALSNIWEMAKTVDIKAVEENFKSVVNLIKNDMMESLMFSILFTIENDTAIDSSNPDILRSHFGIEVSIVGNNNDGLVKKIVLQNFLAKTFLYIINNTKNKTDENQAFVKEIQEESFKEIVATKYLEFKVGWDGAKQTLTLYKEKKENAEADVPEKNLIPTFRRSKPDSTETTKEKIRNNDIPVDNADSESNYQESDIPEISELCKSPLEEFKSAISGYEFEEFISSEPLREFTVSSESGANELEFLYAEYMNKLKDNMYNVKKSLFGDGPDIVKMLSSDHPVISKWQFDGDSRHEFFRYTHKFLTPKLLDMSEELVSVLIGEILPPIETLGHPLHSDINEFKEEIKLYNKLLKTHLTVKGDHFIYNYDEEFIDDEEAKKIWQPLMTYSIKCEDKDKYTESDDRKSNLMAFHETTRRQRAVIRSQYEKIWKGIINSPEF